MGTKRDTPQSAGAVLGQLAVATKSNEIPALRDLLDSMDITDAVVSADAMHCQRETAKHITGRGAHYVLTVKANQPEPARRVQGPALARRARGQHHRPQPPPASPPHHQGRPGLSCFTVSGSVTLSVMPGVAVEVRSPRRWLARC